MRLVYLSPVRWRSFPQRPHKLVEWFHLRHGGDVLWVDPYPTRLPAWRDLRRMSPDWSSGFAEASERAFEWLTVFRPYALPLEPFTGTVGLNRMLLWKVHVAVSNFLSGNGGRVIGIGKPSTLALEVLQRHPDVTSFFDAMDDFPAFYKGVAKRAAERSVDRIASRVSRILISSEALKRRFRSQRSKLLLVRNACDIDALPPVEAVWREGGRPVLGYVGTLGDWFDWPLLSALAETDPSARIRLVGPAYVPPPKPLPDNVEVWPACTHGTAIDAMRNFSVGLIPFKYTELTYSVDPIKYYEYRALGLPIVSSRFGRMAFRDSEPGIFLVDEHSDLATPIRSALGHRDEKNEIEKFRERNSWTARFDASPIFTG